jgi:hypothetical protein
MPKIRFHTPPTSMPRIRTLAGAKHPAPVAGAKHPAPVAGARLPAPAARARALERAA